MQRLKSHIILLAAAIFAAATAWASPNEPVQVDSLAPSTDNAELPLLRPVAQMFEVQIGSGKALDTYLSPITYRGIQTRLGYERTQAMKFNPERWVMRLQVGINYLNAHNPGKNHTMHSLNVDFLWGMMRRWRNVFGVNGLQFFVGPTIDFDGGATYCGMNSNNPVSAQIRLSAGVMPAIVYPVRLGKLPVTLRYEAQLPVLGAFFSPDYGETYYEIYVGNHSGLVHFGWWGNRFDMRNKVLADLHLGNTLLRVGYSGLIHTSYVSKISTRRFTHCFVFGLGGEWMSIKPGTGVSPAAKTISSMY